MVKWALKLILEKGKRWTAIPLEILKCVGEERVFFSNVDIKEFRGLEMIKSEFWKEVIKVWLHKSCTENILKMNKLKVIDQPLFNNKNIRYKGNTLFLEKAIERGIFFINDVFKDGSIMTYTEFQNKYGNYVRAQFDYNIIYNSVKTITDSQVNMKENFMYQNMCSAYKLDNKKLREIIEIKTGEEACGRRI